jgi:hypothetical protein
MSRFFFRVMVVFWRSQCLFLAFEIVSNIVQSIHCVFSALCIHCVVSVCTAYLFTLTLIN